MIEQQTTFQGTCPCHCCASAGTTVPFNAIHEPGAYVCDWSGHLLRVSVDGLTANYAPSINIVGNRPLTVTKLTDNPDVTLTKAKLIANDLSIKVDF
ncbi:MAG: hypothetical protein KKB50_03125 [Planctomycetes bacterium]|nr:hypothetical protein [Planctomycetota bacterium]